MGNNPIEIVDMQGKLVYRASFGRSAIPIQKVVPLNLPEGVYSLIYRHGHQVESISLKK